MHVHQSLFKGDKNAFFDPKGKYYLSKIARSFVAGLLKYAPEITAVNNQWVNSYKRLVPGYEAPVYLSWAKRNRSDLIRVPEYKPGKEKATRIEFRSPDPACNPYLCFSVMLAAGLKGIEEKLEPPEPIEQSVYEMNDEEREKLGIRTLPASLPKPWRSRKRASWCGKPSASMSSTPSSRTRKSSGTATAYKSPTTK